jgi:hypothetical protein
MATQIVMDRAGDRQIQEQLCRNACRASFTLRDAGQGREQGY